MTRLIALLAEGRTPDGSEIIEVTQGGSSVRLKLDQVAALSGGASNGLPTTSPATTNIVLDVAKRQYAPLTIAGPTTITISGSVLGAEATITVIADGVNAPTVSGAQEWMVDAGYLNTLNVPNRLDATYDGVSRIYAWSQAAVVAAVAPPDTTAPVYTTFAIQNGSPTKIVIGVSDAVGVISTLTGTPTISGVSKTLQSATLVGSNVELVYDSAFVDTDVVTVNLPQGYIRDSAGNLSGAVSNQAVTNNVLPVGGSQDAATTAWLSRVAAASGTVSSPTTTAVDAFMATLRGEGILTKISRLNLAVGADLATSLIPQINTVGAAADTANGTPSYDETLGWNCNGSTNYLETGWAPNNLLVGAFGAYLRTAQPVNATAYCLMGSTTGTDGYRIVGNRNPGVTSPTANGHVSSLFGTLVADPALATASGMVEGMWQTARRASNDAVLLLDGAVVATNTDTLGAVAANTVTMTIMAQNSGTRAAFLNSGSRVAGYYISTSVLSDTELITLYDAFQSLQTALARQV